MESTINLENKLIQQETIIPNPLDAPNKTKTFKSLQGLFNKAMEDKILTEKEKLERVKNLLRNTFSLLEDTFQHEEKIYKIGCAISQTAMELSIGTESNNEAIEKKLLPALKELNNAIEPLGLKSQTLDKNTRSHLCKIPDCSALIQSIESLFLEIGRKKEEAIEKKDHSALIALFEEKQEPLKKIKEQIEKMEPRILAWLENTIKLIEKNGKRLFNLEHISSVSQQTTLSEETLKKELKLREKKIQKLKEEHDKLSHKWFKIIEMQDQIAFLLDESSFRGKHFGAIDQDQKGLKEIFSSMAESAKKLENTPKNELGAVYEEQIEKANELSLQLEESRKTKFESLEQARKSFTELGILQAQIKQKTKNRFEKLHLYNDELSKKIAGDSALDLSISDTNFQVLTELYQSGVDEIGKQEGRCLIKKQELFFELDKAKICDQFLREFAQHRSNIENYAASVKKKEQAFDAEKLKEDHKQFMEKSDQLREHSMKALKDLLEKEETEIVSINEALKNIAHFENNFFLSLVHEEITNFKAITEKSNKAISLIEEEWKAQLQQGVDALSNSCVQYLVDKNQNEFDDSVRQYKEGFESDKALAEKNKTLTGSVENFKKLYRERKEKTILESEQQELKQLIDGYNTNSSALGKLNRQSFENMKKELAGKAQCLGRWVEELKTYEGYTNSSNIEIFSQGAKEQSAQLGVLESEHKDLWTCMNSFFGSRTNQQSFAYELCRIKYAMNRGTRVLPTDFMFGQTVFGWDFKEEDLIVKSPLEKTENK